MDTKMLNGYTRTQRVQGFSRRTVARRRWSLGLWAQHLACNGRTVGEATIDDVEAFLDRWPSAQTRQSMRSDLRMFYRWAIDRGQLEVDPVDGVPAPKVPKRAASPIPADELLRLLADEPAGRARLAVMLGAYAGLRCSEIGALRGDDIDVAGRMLIVQHGKGDKFDTIPLCRELIAELERWPQHGPLLGVSGGTVGDLIRRAFRRHDITGRPHDLRHSFGTTIARRTDGNLILTQQLMRHERPETTIRYVKWHTTGHEVLDGLYGDAA
jgi:integrase